MKTSQKILATIAGVFMLVFVISLFVLREEANETVARYRLETGFRPVDIDEFDHLEFGPGWDVTITGGLGTYVSVKLDEQYELAVHKVNNKLVLGVDDSSNVNHGGRVRIMVIDLKSIKAAEGTMVELSDLELDSLSVVLENTESFSGVNTNIKHLSMYTSGEVALEFSQID